jgi:hypothetical protein
LKPPSRGADYLFTVARCLVQSGIVGIGAVAAFLLLGMPGVLGWIAGALSFISMRDGNPEEFAEADVR